MCRSRKCSNLRILAGQNNSRGNSTTTHRSLDSCIGNYLNSQGMAASGSAPTGASDQTVVIVYSPKLYALRYLIQMIGIKSSNQIIIKPTSSPQVDIELRLGNDALHKIPGC